MMSVAIPAATNLLGGLVFGYDTGTIGLAKEALKNDTSVVQEFTSTMDAVITSSIVAGAAIGSLTGGMINDAIGRKKSAIVMSIITALFSIITAVLPNIWLIAVARLLLGIGVGFTSVVCPVYVAEVSPAELRGRLGSLFQVSITFGLLVAYGVCYGLLKGLSSDISWRVMFGLGAIPSIAHLILAIFFMPESDLWLYKKETPSLLSVQDGASASDAPAPVYKQGWRALFTREHAAPLITGAVLGVTQQLTGINGIIFYMPTIFSQANFSDVLSKTLPIVVMGVNFVATFVALALVDRAGRRPLMIYGVGIMLACEIVMTAIFGASATSGTVSSTMGWILFIAICIFHLGFEIAPGTLFWIIVNETFPTRVRDQAVGFINLLTWAFNWTISFTFPILLDALGNWQTFTVLTTICAVCFVYTLIFIRETRGTRVE